MVTCAPITLLRLTIAVFAQQGTNIILQSGACSKSSQVSWRSLLFNGTNGGHVRDDGLKYRLRPYSGDLQILHVGEKDVGLYYATVNSSANPNVVYLLDISFHGTAFHQVTVPYRRSTNLFLPDHNLMVSYRLSKWSPCTACDGQTHGLRNRLEICYVRIHNVTDPKVDPFLRSFADGLPCSSNYLPSNLSRIPALKSAAHSQIWGNCTVKYDEKTAKRDSRNLSVRLVEGQEAIVECPNEARWAMTPVIVWLMGNRTVRPWETPNNPRISVDMVGRLRIFSARNSDNELTFSCCSGTQTVANIKLHVSSSQTWPSLVLKYAPYVGYGATACVLLSVACTMLADQQLARLYG